MHDGEAIEQRTLIRRGLRIAAGYVRAHKLPFSVSVLGSVTMAVGTVLSTVMLGWLTDDVVLPVFEGTDAGRGRWTVILAVLGVALATSTGIIVRRYFAGMTVHRNRSDLQNALGNQYLAMPAADMRVAPKGRYLAYADSETDVATDMISPLPFTIGVITLIVVSVVSLALTDWVLMLVALALMPLVGVLNQINARASKGPAVDTREGVAKVSTVASESFDGALVVKTLGRQDAELQRFSEAASDLRDASVRLGRVRAIFGAALDLLPDLGVVTLVVVGAWRVGNDHISTGQLVQAVVLFTILVFPLRVISYFFSDIPPGVVAHDRIRSVMERLTETRSGTAALPDGPLSLEVRGLSVAYGDAPAVDAVDLDVAAGEVVALVGQTGCGKSTLLTAVLDMVPTSGGTVRIDQQAVADVAVASLAQRTAMAWQEPFLLASSVADNIAFGLELSDVEIEQAAEQAAFASVVGDLPDGYDTVVGERGVRLSGGQRQRLALARAFARRPGLLLLDDATSAVDPVIEEQILAQVRALGTTMVIVAHRRSTIRLADRVVLMQRGRVVASGTHDEMLEVPAYVSLLEAYDTEVGS